MRDAGIKVSPKSHTKSPNPPSPNPKPSKGLAKCWQSVGKGWSGRERKKLSQARPGQQPKIEALEFRL